MLSVRSIAGELDLRSVRPRHWPCDQTSDRNVLDDVTVVPFAVALKAVRGMVGGSRFLLSLAAPFEKK
jgi:hypothetical protein